jgi:hypothetical protein
LSKQKNWQLKEHALNLIGKNKGWNHKTKLI